MQSHCRLLVGARRGGTWVGAHDLLLDAALARCFLPGGGEDLEDVLGALGFARAGLPGYQYTLVPLGAHEFPKGLGCHTEDVRVLCFTRFVQLHYDRVVDVNSFPGIDGNEDRASV